MSQPQAAPVTGWLKKEADKGLKVGNLIKKPFHDRWFVLDLNEAKLNYFDKKDSEAVKGNIDLAKITKLAKTGKHPCEFMIETLDDATGPKVSTLQAPTVAQMDLWIKAIGIVKEAAKRKAAVKQEPSSSAPASAPGSGSLPSTSSPQPSQTTSTPETTPEKPIEAAETPSTTAVEPLETSTISVTPAKSLQDSSTQSTPSPSSDKSPTQAKATTSPSSTPKVSSPIAPRPSGPKSGGSFLGTQRASMHPAIASPLKSTSQVATITSQFEAPPSKQGPARWSTALTPSNNTTQSVTATATPIAQVEPSSSLSSSKETPFNNATPVAAPNATSGKHRTSTPTTSSTPPSSSTPSVPISTSSTATKATQRSSLPTTESKPNSTPLGATPTKSHSSSLPMTVTPNGTSNTSSEATNTSQQPIPSPEQPKEPLPSIAEKFIVGDKEVYVRSSLSSLAPQAVGQLLLSENPSLEMSEPLVRASPGPSSSTEHLRASDSKRLGPSVPSPMSLLELEINRSYDEETTVAPPIRERDNVISVQTPDAFMVLLKHSKRHPEREVLIQLGERVLMGINGTWVAQDTYFGEAVHHALEADFDPETGYTWQLPGFLQVRWHRHNVWTVSTREASPSDEIKWNLLGVGKLLESYSSFLSLPRQALLYHLYASVNKIMEETAEVREAYDIPLEQQGEKLATPALELLVRRDLCTRIAAVLLDGFNDWSIFRKYHIYDFLHDASLDRQAVSGFGALQLPLVIADVEASSEDPNMRFRNFIVSALNQHNLYTWVAHLFKNQPQVSDYYEDESLVRQLPLVILNALAPLSSISLHMPLESGTKAR